MVVQQVRVGAGVLDVRLEGPGSGVPVVLLHGFPQDGSSFDAVVPRLHEAGLRTVVPDQRGYSPGARPEGVAAYAVGELVADAVGLLDALGIGWAHVVGHDWGAAVAWQLAARHPERVSSLVAASVGHPVAFSAAMATDLDQRERSAYIGLFTQEGKAEDVLLADDATRLRAMLGDGATLAPALLQRDALTAALSWYRGMRGADYRDCPAVQVPTTFLWGSEDHALGRLQAATTGRHVHGEYRFVELAGVGHWIPEHAPAALATEVVLRSSPW